MTDMASDDDSGDLLDDLNKLTARHRAACSLYGDYISALFGNEEATTLAEVPYLPVRAFKTFDLKSIADADVFKVMTSSGTTGAVSRIHLDRETAKLQSQRLAEVFADAFTKSRFPMLVIDAESTVTDRREFSARTAAINGFGLFSKGREFALDENFAVDVDRIMSFVEANRGQRIFLFGFTFVVWRNFATELKRMNVRLDLSNAFLLHGGGWKKLADQNISNERFKAEMLEWTGCRDVRNYYGMVEQTGTIFMECEHGHLHAARGSDAIIRDRASFAALPYGAEGLIEIFSTIQKSYPGHALLTEDVGHTLDGATCVCGRKGTIVKIAGRLTKAEIRGCSDAYHPHL